MAKEYSILLNEEEMKDIIFSLIHTSNDFDKEIKEHFKDWLEEWNKEIMHLCMKLVEIKKTEMQD